MASKETLELLQAMGEIYGRQMNPMAAKVYLATLEHLGDDVIQRALKKALGQSRTFPTVAEIKALAAMEDGRPGPEEAWQLVPKSEYDSTVWTDEIAQAFSAVAGAMDDQVSGRMAFLEVYKRILLEAREMRKPVRWYPSFGFDVHSRDAALTLAVSKGRMTLEQACKHSPQIESQTKKELTAQGTVKALVDKAFKEIPKSLSFVDNDSGEVS